MTDVRPRKKDRNLPPCVYQKHGAFWYVKKNKWHRLGTELGPALMEYAKLAYRAESGMVELINKALPYLLDGKAPGTVDQYERAAERLKEILAEFSPEQLRQRDVAAIRDHLRATPNMANRIITFLRLVMNYAVDWQIIDNNPCIGIKRLPEKKRDRYLTDAEFRAIYDNASENLKPIMLVCYYTGQRISDVLAIRMSDVSDDGIYFVQKKTRQKVLIAMTPELKAAIEQARALPRKAQGMTLFCSARGSKPYDYSTVKQMWRTAVAKASLQERATLHDLRAKAITDAKNQGLNAQALGGHATEAMTNRYIRARDTVVAQPPSFRQAPK